MTSKTDTAPGGGCMAPPRHVRVQRGEVFYADLDPVVGSEQGGIRPVVILQNDVGNQCSPTTIVASITSQVYKARLPVHVLFNGDTYGLERESVIQLEQIRTIDKRRLRERVGRLDGQLMDQVDLALDVSLGRWKYLRG